MQSRNVIAIGGSLGSVTAIKRLCSEFSGDFAAAICVVVHVGSRGNNLLADIFNDASPLRVKTAEEGDRLAPSHIYVAPADHHLLVIDGIVRLGRGPRENMARPAIDPLFRSVALSYGPRAIAVLLSGLLDDGSAGLADVKRCRGITIVQSPDDAEAPDMPLNALRASEVDYRAPLADMARLIMRLAAQDAEAPGPVPDRLRLEVDIARGLQLPSHAMADIAAPVPLSCPACGGVLAQLHDPAPLRFRCQVGHAFTATALADAQEGTVDEAVRVAMRIMNERAVLTDKLADEAKRKGQNATAAVYKRQAQHIRASVQILAGASVASPEANG